MKKLISAAAALIAVSALGMTAFADTVYVTISDGNGLKVSQEAIDVSDADGDGALTVTDALICAHDKFYDGGAEAGYATSEGDYGPMVSKLWGVENGGSYGYYVNSASAFSPVDPISEGDYIDAFAYSDLTAWSDMYCYFNTRYVEGNDLPEYTLTGAGFDENWNPVAVPIAGAEITLNGEKTGIITDENGKFGFAPKADGTYVISAVSDSQVLVPPVSILVAAGFDNVPVAVDDTSAQETQAPAAAGDVQADSVSSKGSPDTGIADVAATAGIAITAAGALIAVKRRK